MKAATIKRILREALEDFENIPDDFDLQLESNTYFLGTNCSKFLGISGFNGGYISLESEDLEDYQRNYGEEVYLDDYVDRFVDWHENMDPNNPKLDELYAILDKTGEEDIYEAYLALDDEDQLRCLEIAGIKVN